MSRLSKYLRMAEDRTANVTLLFICPACNEPHGIPIGNGPAPRWQYNHDAEHPTFSPSVLVRTAIWKPETTADNSHPPGQTMVTQVCHSFVTGGRIQYLSDCTHQLAGQNVELGHWPEQKYKPIC